MGIDRVRSRRLPFRIIRPPVPAIFFREFQASFERMLLGCAKDEGGTLFVGVSTRMLRAVGGRKLSNTVWEFDDVRFKRREKVRGLAFLCEIIERVARRAQAVHALRCFVSGHQHARPLRLQTRQRACRCRRRRRAGRGDREMVALLDGTFWASEAAFLRGTKPISNARLVQDHRLDSYLSLSSLLSLSSPLSSPSPASSSPFCAPYALQQRP